VKVRIDRDSRVAPYEQIRLQLEGLILRGRLAPGERVPPVRELAEELGIAPNTAAKAYRALEAAGLLAGRGRHGTFVAERLPSRSSDAEARLREAARVYAARARRLGFGAELALRVARRELRSR
jgi:DNA-binding transcriptional regulator YhcF (GntR family)